MIRNETAKRRNGETAKEQKKTRFFKPDRLLVFLVATIALANFFEAGRIITAEKTFAHIPQSIFSLFIFLSTLVIMGYWIYKEEKERNNIKHKFGLYEWFYRKRTGEPASWRWGEKK